MKCKNKFFIVFNRLVMITVLKNNFNKTQIILASNESMKQIKPNAQLIIENAKVGQLGFDSRLLLFTA